MNSDSIFAVDAEGRVTCAGIPIKGWDGAIHRPAHWDDQTELKPFAWPGGSCLVMTLVRGSTDGPTHH